MKGDSMSPENIIRNVRSKVSNIKCKIRNVLSFLMDKRKNIKSRTTKLDVIKRGSRYIPSSLKKYASMRKIPVKNIVREIWYQYKNLFLLIIHLR